MIRTGTSPLDLASWVLGRPWSAGQPLLDVWTPCEVVCPSVKLRVLLRHWQIPTWGHGCRSEVLVGSRRRPLFRKLGCAVTCFLPLLGGSESVARIRKPLSRRECRNTTLGSEPAVKEIETGRTVPLDAPYDFPAPESPPDGSYGMAPVEARRDRASQQEIRPAGLAGQAAPPRARRLMQPRLRQLAAGPGCSANRRYDRQCNATDVHGGPTRSFRCPRNCSARCCQWTKSPRQWGCCSA